MSSLPSRIHINDDCAAVVVQYLASDFVALANLLRVSKQWFQAVVPVLYARPLAPPQSPVSLIPVPVEISRFSRERLWFLLGLCSGFLERVYGWDPKQQDGIYLPPLWQDEEVGGGKKRNVMAVKMPTTVNYFEYVKELPLESRLYFGWEPDQKLWKDHFVQHIIFHGSRLCTFYMVSTTLLSFIWEHQLMDLLPNLKTLRLSSHTGQMMYRGAPTASSDEEGELMEKIVQRHVDLFPNQLKELIISNQDKDWDLYMRLLQKLQSFEKVEITLSEPAIRVSFLPYLNLAKDSVREFSLYMRGLSLDGLSEWLSQCRYMERLRIVFGPPDAFKWARLEQEQFDECHKQKLAILNSSQNHRHAQPRHLGTEALALPSLSPLVPVKIVNFTGHGLDVYDAVSGFRHTLQEIYLNVHEPYPSQPRLLPWLFSLPSLKILWTSGQWVAINTLARNCPNLEELTIQSSNSVVLPEAPIPIEHGGDGLPKKLRLLHLTGHCLFRTLDTDFMKLTLPLYATLEVLELVVHSVSIYWSQYIGDQWANEIQQSGIRFLRLKKLWLDGDWMQKYMGSFLVICPNLEYAKFSTRSGNIRKFDLDTFLPFESFQDARMGTDATQSKTPSSSTPTSEQQEPSTVFGYSRVQNFQGLYPNLKELRFEHIELFGKSTLDQQCTKRMAVQDLVLSAKSPFPNLEKLVLKETSFKELQELKQLVATMMDGQKLGIRSLMTLTVDLPDSALKHGIDFDKDYRRLVGGDVLRVQGRKRFASNDIGGCVLITQDAYFAPK